jgi:hypothetical protein
MRAQIVVTLDLSTTAMTPEIRRALDALADVMAVQAEDGLFTLGSPEAEGEEPNEYLSDLRVTGVLVQSP